MIDTISEKKNYLTFWVLDFSVIYLLSEMKSHPTKRLIFINLKIVE